MRLKRFLAYLAVFVIILAVLPATVLAIWVIDDGAETGTHTFQCKGNGKLEIRFFDNEGAPMNFFESDGEFFADEAGLVDAYLKAGFTDAGNFLFVTSDGQAARVTYNMELYGYFELTPIPEAGFILNRFLDYSCGCPVQLEHVGDVYHALPGSAETLEAIFIMDPNWVNVSPTLNMTFNGAPIYFDVPPFIENDRTMVPVRFIGETLGAEATWVNETKTVTITAADGLVIVLVSGNSDMVVIEGGETRIIPMGVTTVIRDGRAFVPVRFIAEALGLTVEWNGQTKTVSFSG